jgi:hypothetical protein
MIDTDAFALRRLIADVGADSREVDFGTPHLVLLISALDL